MSSRQRWLALFNRQTPDRIPTDYWTTPEFHAKLRDHLAKEQTQLNAGTPARAGDPLAMADDRNIWKRLHIDMPQWVGPKQVRMHHPDDPDADLWGIRFQRTDYGTGSYNETAHNPLAKFTTVDEVEAYRWPSADDYDFDNVQAILSQVDDARPVRGGIFEPFLLYCNLRGMEQAFEDLLLEPKLAHAILTKIFEFHYEFNRRTYEAAKGRIDFTYIAEDLGGQTSPLMSLKVYREFLLPNQVKMADLARKHGAHIFYHTDGSADIFIPDLIDKVGIELLNPIQWRCPGMERDKLVRDFGQHVIFHGAMDNQYTLPFGTVDEVIAEVHENRKLFENARWVCAPCHNIQPVTPPENIVAMYDTIHEIGAL